MTKHDLKCWPEFFEPTLAGVKTFEIRRDDRGFKVGDRLHLREWNPNNDCDCPGGVCMYPAIHVPAYTGRECWATVTYLMVLDDLPEQQGVDLAFAREIDGWGYVAMAIRLEEAQ